MELQLLFLPASDSSLQCLHCSGHADLALKNAQMNKLASSDIIMSASHSPAKIIMLGVFPPDVHQNVHVPLLLANHMSGAYL